VGHSFAVEWLRPARLGPLSCQRNGRQATSDDVPFTSKEEPEMQSEEPGTTKESSNGRPLVLWTQRLPARVGPSFAIKQLQTARLGPLSQQRHGEQGTSVAVPFNSEEEPGMQSDEPATIKESSNGRPLVLVDRMGSKRLPLPSNSIWKKDLKCKARNLQ
jgi:hypothetical protein